MAKSKKTKDDSPQKPSSLFRQILAQSLPILGLLLAIFLILGRFNYGGPAPVKVSDLMSQGIGWLSWTFMPLAIIYLAVLKFKQLETSFR